MSPLSAEQIAKLNYRYDDYATYDDNATKIPGDPLIFRDADGDAALHMAAIAEDVEAVSWLLNAGIDPNALGDMGQTALHWAIANKNKEMAELLVSFGARTDIIDEFGIRSDLSVFED
ncbi:ankyrin repeat domain-containing protein [Sphingomonas populi]|uniref:Ankyrin repeat domain-containing protein n=1 Tax=Sphingomonas populi TaxID=2484750 RepID=A0A4Q6XHG1_9SPHN|nr:ankyrin repeat domain-containing protein [Sphingomonas populi]RZF59013.1 ankyrin repeat domain-containing protein [Sphingomonas populi]